MKSNGDGPIVALDIDGTIGDYHSHFLRFAESWYGREMPSAATINPGLPLHKHMRTSKATYRRCKLAYRQGGLKRSMPCYPGARELLIGIRKAGAEAWITTTRPYLRYDTIDPDTREFLRRNRLPYDGLLYGERKYRDLYRIAGEGLSDPGKNRVAAVLDDLPEMYTQAAQLNMYPILRDQPYNQHFTSLVIRVNDLYEAKECILKHIGMWRDRNG